MTTKILIETDSLLLSEVLDVVIHILHDPDLKGAQVEAIISGVHYRISHDQNDTDLVEIKGGVE